MRLLLRKVVTLVVLFAFVGCATILTGSSDNVSIVSDPQGGKVYLNGNYMGNAPISLTLKRDKDYNVMMKKDGYEPATATITRSFNAVAILNLGGLLCWVVDIVTGAMWKFDRDTVTVVLEKAGPGTTSGISNKRGIIVAGEKMLTTPYNGKTALLLNEDTAQ